MRRLSLWLLAAFLGLSSPGFVVAQASPGDEPDLPATTAATAATAAWTKTTLDTTRDVGTHVGVAIDPTNGAPYVSYYDQANGDLRFARYVGSGGYCGPGDSWECDAIDATNDNGPYNSIAVRYTGTYTAVAVAYQNVDNAKLKVILGQCWPPATRAAQRAPDTAPTGCSFTAYEIATGSPPSTKTGLYTSVAYDLTGVPFVAYQTYSATGNESVRVAHPVASGGNCGLGGSAGTWQCDTIMSGNGLGSYASIAIDGLNRPHLAFYDPAVGQPYHAVRIGSGGNCGPSNSWLCQPVLTNSRVTGRSTALFVEADGTAHLAYLDTTSSTHKKLIYASYVGSGGNCGYSSISSHFEWQCDVIDDDLGNVGTGRTVAVAPDPSGEPMIAYRDQAVDLAPPVLKFAQPYYAAPGGSVPNCGPYDLMYTWVCSNVDIGGTWQEEAAAVAMAGNSAGRAISYHELDTYAYPAEGNLKVANEIFALFSDGFESGGMTRWSAQVP